MIRLLSLVVAFALSLGLGLAWAQTPTPTLDPTPEVTPLPTLSPEPLAVAPADLGVDNPTPFQFFKRKFVRVFTFNKVKKEKVNLDLANLTLLRARQAALAGDTDRAQTLLADYNTQINQINQRVSQFLTTLPDDSKVTALVDRLAEDKVLQIEVLDNLKLVAADQKFNTEVTKVRLEVTKKLAQLLTKENLTPEELAQKLAKLEDKLAAKETKAELKHLRRLSLLEDLDEASDDPEFEEGLENERKETVTDAAKTLPTDKLGALARSIPGDLFKHLAILKAVLDHVPEAAKPALEKVIDEQTEKLADKIEKSEERVDQFEEGHDKDVVKAQKEVVKDLKKRFKKEQQHLDELEKKEAAFGKKLDDDAAEPDDEADQPDEATTPSPTATSPASPTAKSTTATPSPTATKTSSASPTSTTTSPSPTATESSSRLDIDLEIKGFAFSKTLTLEKGRKTRIRAENKDSSSHTLTIAGLNVSTGTIKANERGEIEFTPEKTGTFTITCDFHSSMSGSATVN